MPNLRDVIDLIPAGAIQSAGSFIVQLGNDLSRCSSRYSEIFLSFAHQSFSISPAAAFLIDRHQFDLSLIVLYRSAENGVPPFFSGDDPDPAGGESKQFAASVHTVRPEMAENAHPAETGNASRCQQPTSHSGKSLEKTSTTSTGRQTETVPVSGFEKTVLRS